MYDPAYMEQVRLLLQCMPTVATCDCFALKGGSGINLFLRDMPRVSVDIDLTYLPVQPRAASLSGIEEALKRIKSRIEEDLDDIVVNPSVIQGHVAKLTVGPGPVGAGGQLRRQARQLDIRIGKEACHVRLVPLAPGRLPCPPDPDGDRTPAPSLSPVPAGHQRARHEL